MADQFRKYGHFGSYYGAKVFTGGELALTGSNFGYGAFIRTGSNHEGNITIAGGAAIPINHFAENTFYEIAVSEISGSTVFGGQVTFFKR
mgnify:CR=1 FL=1